MGDAVYQYQKKTVRKMILKDHKRPDGRKIDEIRPLAAEVDLLPRVHGSGMFTRGQTQILNACTLAPLSEAQRLDGLDENETTKRYMHHYNFPSFSVGEQSALFCRYFPAKRSSPTPSVLYLRPWNPTDPPPRPASVLPPCP